MLDPVSPIPLYYQLKTILLDQILQGDWKVGDLLPSENELAQAYKVSRATVRRALAELQREGRVHTRKGKGSIVAQPKIEQDLLRFYSLARSFGKEPHQVSSRILYLDKTNADPVIARHLCITTTTPVVIVRRLRCLDKHPIMLETSYLPSSICPGLEQETHLEALYDHLEARYGIYVSRAEEFLQAVSATKEEASYLQLPRDMPVFLVERIAYAPDATAVEFRRSIIRADRFRYKVELR
ncbi:MAG: GntR family transcriptional regulator [Firmicutes bacterium]|nr:GntR family transcriptional regulator [Bacillota bacterium]